jgi:CRISPR/Cas system CMR-associated protein Cmr1 (group 7 of RAMP superfamily)
MNKKEIKKLINENVYWQMSVYKLRKIKKNILDNFDCWNEDDIIEDLKKLEKLNVYDCERYLILSKYE